jgi:hypothetical protein
LSSQAAVELSFCPGRKGKIRQLDMTLLIATRNRGKFAEIAEALVSLHLELRGAFDYPDVPTAEGTEARNNA